MTRWGRAATLGIGAGIVGGLLIAQPASAQDGCNDGSSNSNFTAVGGTTTTNNSDAWRFEAKRTGSSGYTQVNAWSYQAQQLGPFGAQGINIWVGKWSSGNFAALANYETVYVDGSTTNVAYMRSCTKI